MEEMPDALGHNHVAEVTKAATCEEDGIRTFTCSRCGDSYEEAIPAIGHTDGNVEILPADCGNNERSVTYCSVCGKVIEEVDLFEQGVGDEALGHDYEAVVTAPTCEEEGYTTYTCSRCGDEYTDDVTEAAGHSYQDVVTAPTCKKQGYTTKVCSVCGHSYIDEDSYVPVNVNAHTPVVVSVLRAATCTATGIGKMGCSECGKVLGYAVTPAAHSYNNGVVTAEAACTAGGVKTFTCTVCGHTYTEAVPALGHSYNEGVVTKAANCGAAGELTFTCTRCGDSYAQEIPAAGEHQWKESIVDATCTEGTKIGNVCEVCGEAAEDVEELPNALGHNHVAEVTKAATCEEDGVRTLTCSRCGDSHEEAIPATGHTEGDVEILPADCGNNERSVTYCSVCGKIIEVVDLFEQGVGDEALGHDYEAVVTAPTCMNQGYTTYVCSQCGYSYVDEDSYVPVNENAHKPVRISVLLAATCTTTGIERVRCSECGKDLGYAVIPAMNPSLVHTEEIIPAVAATCTTAGKTVGKECSVCGKILVAPTVIPALDHTEEIIPAVASTCATAGNMEGKKCSTCGEILVAPAVIPALGHTEETIPAVAATCTTAGSVEGKKCSTCGEILVAPAVIPAIGHTEETIPAVAATCTTAGSVEGKKCSTCGEILVAPAVIPLLGHTEETIPAAAASCTTAGSMEGKKCSVCGEILVAPILVPALGHHYISTVVAPAIGKQGYTEHICSLCGDSYKDSYSDPLSATARTTGRAIVRNTASDSGTNLIRLEAGVTVTITGGMTNNYYPVLLNDGTAGYIYYSYLSLLGQ